MEIAVLIWLLAGFWTTAGLWHLWRLWRWPRLPRGVRSGDAPRVSLLLPARNEADRMLGHCVESLLAQDYPNLEIVAVDDCSTDGTGTLLEKLSAGSGGRMKFITGAAPPRGWMGKTWALEQASRAASGEWLLIVDADVTLDPSLVSDAVSVAVAGKWDAVTLMPRHGSDDFWVRAAMPLYEWIVTAALPLVHRDGAGDDRGSACGAFFLIRRACLERAGGFSSVADRVAEDITLARRLKASGSRLTYRRATDRFWTPHYRNGHELVRGFAKNLWTPDFGIVRGLMLSLLLVLLGLGPLAGALWGHPVGVAALCVQIAAFAPAYADSSRNIVPWRALLAPFILALMGILVLVTMWQARTGTGIRWKDRAVHATGTGKE